MKTNDSNVDKVKVETGNHLNPSPDETLATVVKSTEQTRRMDALDKLSEIDQDMGRYDE